VAGIDMYVVEQPAAAAPDGGPLPDDFANDLTFRTLPLVALPSGSPAPEGARSVRRDYPLPLARIARALDWCVRPYLSTINISLGPFQSPPDSPSDPDPLAEAIRTVAAHNRTVVVAAGNRGPNLDTLQFFARLPETISVGALGEDGTLLATSSRGVPGKSGPTFVASGVIDTPDPRFPQPGTSFAAPRVTRVGAWLQMFLRLIMADVRSLAAGPLPAIQAMPRPGIAVLDTASGGPDTSLEPTIEVPRSDREERWYRGLFDALGERYGMSCAVGDVPSIVRRALVAIARRLPLEPHEAGAGAIDVECLRDAVAFFYPQRFIDFFCTPEERAKISGLDLARLNGEFGPLFEGDTLALLRDAVASKPYLIPLRVFY
jgi:hypothetical protein